MSTLKNALALAARGFRVFPLTAGMKDPFLKDWPGWATAQPDAVKRMWKQWDSRDVANIGLAMGEGLVAFDYDVKGDRDGLQDKAVLETIYDLPETLEFRTPSGGVHAIYRLPDGVKVGNSVGHPMSGVDIRGERGYIVGPGSRLKGMDGDGVYEILHDRPIADINGPVLNLLKTKRRRERTGDASQPVTDLDNDYAIKMATDYLVNRAPEAVEGAGGNDTTYKVAARCKDFGVSRETCLELMFEHYNLEKCFGPWDSDELEGIVNNAYEYGENPPGVADQRRNYEPYEIDEDALGEHPDKVDDRRREGVVIESLDDVYVEKRRDYLVKGLIDRGMIAMLTGPSGVGKSPFALDMAAAIASGETWCGMRTKRSYCAYIGAEGHTALSRRRAALAKHRSVPLDGSGAFPLDFIKWRPNLHGNIKDVKFLRDTILERAEKYEVEPGLIIVDTLSQTLGKANENNADEVRDYMRNVKRLIEATGAAVMFLHHPPKEEGRTDWRGSGALVNDIDLMLVAKGVKDAGNKKLFDVFTGRVKDYAEIEHMRFAIAVEVVGVDDEGEDLTAPVARFAGPSASFEDQGELGISEDDRKVLHIVEQILESGKKGVAPLDSVNFVRTNRLRTDDADYERERKRADRIFERLVSAGYLVKTHKNQHVRTGKP